METVAVHQSEHTYTNDKTRVQSSRVTLYFRLFFYYFILAVLPSSRSLARVARIFV